MLKDCYLFDYGRKPFIDFVRGVLSSSIFFAFAEVFYDNKLRVGQNDIWFVLLLAFMMAGLGVLVVYSAFSIFLEDYFKFDRKKSDRIYFWFRRFGCGKAKAFCKLIFVYVCYKPLVLLEMCFILLSVSSLIPAVLLVVSKFEAAKLMLH